MLKLGPWMVALWGFGAVAQGQTRVAVVDVEKVFAQYDRTAYLEELFESRRRMLLEEAEKKRQSLESKQQMLLQAVQPGTADYDEKSRELKEERIRFEIWRQLEDDGLKQDHKQSLLIIYDDVRQIVKQVADERGLEVVLTYDNLTKEAPDSVSLRQQILLQKVIYFNPRVDLTDTVITRLNDRFKQMQSSGQGGTGAGKMEPRGDAPLPADRETRLAESAARPNAPTPGAASEELSTDSVKPFVSVKPSVEREGGEGAERKTASRP